MNVTEELGRRVTFGVGFGVFLMVEARSNVTRNKRPFLQGALRYFCYVLFTDLAERNVCYVVTCRYVAVTLLRCLPLLPRADVSFI